MIQKKMNPAPRCTAGTGFGLDTCGQAVSGPKYSTKAQNDNQPSHLTAVQGYALRQISRQARISLSHAALIAELSGMGSFSPQEGWR
jgi:hypothetical protein